MKIVVSADSVIHLWANQVQATAKTPTRNLFFETNCLYSYGYHYVIGELRDGFVLLNERKVSVTTAKQMWSAVAGTRHLNQVFVPDLNFIHMSLDIWKSQLEQLESKLPRAIKKDYILSKIRSINNQINRFVYYLPEYSINTELAKLMAIPELPEYVAFMLTVPAREERERIKKEAIQVERRAIWDENRRKYDEQRVRDAEQHKETAKTNIEKFRSFQISRLYNTFQDTGVNYPVDLLRFDKSLERVETSQGVQVPLKVAVQFYADLLNLKGTTGPVNLKLMNAYSVQSVTEVYISVGCHTIMWDEIEAVVTTMREFCLSEKSGLYVGLAQIGVNESGRIGTNNSNVIQ